MTEMKYYITYANWKPEAQGQEAMKNSMKKWTKKIEETGCEVVFWGAALGVSEGAVCVIKGTPENWMKIYPPDAPYTNTRTNVVITF